MEAQQVTETTINNIPPEVISKSILPHLDWNDLLRARRVSPNLKACVNGYIRSNVELVPELEICETDRTVSDFLSMNLPTTKVFLNNLESGYEYFANNADELKRFLELFGTGVRHLRISKLPLYMMEGTPECDFFSGLPNLESVLAEDFSVNYQNCYNVQFVLDPEDEDEDAVYPEVFKRLKTLRINLQDIYRDANITEKAFFRLQFSESVKHAAIPFSYFIVHEGQDRIRKEILLGGYFETLKEFVILNERAPNLELFDFEYFYPHGKDQVLMRRMETMGSQWFLELLVVCYRENIKLASVNASWFQAMWTPPHLIGNLGEASASVVSMVNLHPFALQLDMTNLKKLVIRGTSRCVMLCGNLEFLHGPEWPLLQGLDVTMDSQMTDAGRALNLVIDPVPCGIIWKFLFVGVRRTALTELSLVFTPEGERVLPRAADIVSACPNLKKFLLVNWKGKNKALARLWEGLRGLEEITLDSCTEMSNGAFVGEDVENPVFLRLERLQKLTLRGVDKMPKITDILFNLVLQHLPLKKLTLQSDSALTKVTAAGVRLLQNGRFAGSIEKFPFEGWSLADCNPEEFRTLGAEFRSHNMI